jgi:hypothetical protein
MYEIHTLPTRIINITLLMFKVSRVQMKSWAELEKLNNVKFEFPAV